jgi:hypothetical protein
MLYNEAPFVHKDAIQDTHSSISSLFLLDGMKLMNL